MDRIKRISLAAWSQDSGQNKIQPVAGTTIMSQGEFIETPDETEIFTVGDNDRGLRLDVWINTTRGFNSRNRIKELLKLGGIQVNGRAEKPAYRVRPGDVITIVEEPNPPGHLLAEDIPIQVVFEDATMLVLNKPPYQAVHPGPGCRTGTLANALYFHFRELSDISGPERPGIVHRLDRDTSGIMCVAKNNRAHFAITTQFQERTVEKTYEAITEGVMEFDEYVVEKPIGRHPSNPLKMACVADGRPSLTRFEVLRRFDNFTWVRCFPKTGRTHQIRVHLASLGHPILCDRVYGRRARLALGDLAAMSPGDSAEQVLLDRQALHARTLSLYHPMRGERLSFEAPLAADIQSVLDALALHARSTRGSKGKV